MWPILLGFFVAAALSDSAARPAEKRPLEEKKEKTKFTPRNDPLRVRFKDIAHNGVGMRCYQPTYDPAPWVLHVGVSDDYIEQFAFTPHPDIERFAVKIYPHQERPIDLQRIFERKKDYRDKYAVPLDPQFNVPMYRYLHDKHGRSPQDWFVISITVRGFDKSWLFEHPSSYHQLLRSRAKLPAPSAEPAPKAWQENVRQYFAETEGKAQQSVAELKNEIERLRSEIPELIKAQRRYEESPEGVGDLLEGMTRITAYVKTMHEKIDATAGIDDAQRQDLHDIANDVQANMLDRFKRSVAGELHARTRAPV